MEVVVVLTTEQNQTKLIGSIRTYPKAKALKKALLFYLGTLILAFGCVFIPIIHFVAVPGLLLLGPIASFLSIQVMQVQRM